MSSYPKAITLSPQALDVDYISTTETLTTPWTLQLDGVTTLTQPQHVTITCSSDESLATFTVVGTDRYGNALSEAITGPTAAATVTTTKNFKTVTSITSTLDATGVTAGVNGACDSQWYVLNHRGPQFNVAVAKVFSATATAHIEYTYNNVLASGFLEDDAVLFLATGDLATGTADGDGSFTNPPFAIRLAVTAHTSGTVTMYVNQVLGGS